MLYIYLLFILYQQFIGYGNHSGCLSHDDLVAFTADSGMDGLAGMTILTDRCQKILTVVFVLFRL